MNLSPVVLFVYNRPWHTRRSLKSLAKNELASRSKLIIYSDGPKNMEDSKSVEEVRKYIQSVNSFYRVRIEERKKNIGLAQSISRGVTEVINKYGRVIVLEDDMITSPLFLTFMNRAMDLYCDNSKIYSITGYTLLLKALKKVREDAYLTYRNSCWGWGTFLDRWEGIDWQVCNYEDFVRDKLAVNAFSRGGKDLPKLLDLQLKGKLDSWSIIWDYHCFKNDGLCLAPRVPLLRNIGLDNSGIHCEPSLEYDIPVKSVDSGKWNFQLPKIPVLHQNVVDETYDLLSQEKSISLVERLRNKAGGLIRKYMKKVFR